MSTFKILPKTIVFPNLQCFSKKRLFEEIAECASFIFKVKTKDIIATLNQREQYGSTVVTDGLAMPIALVVEADAPLAILAILSNSIGFNTVDMDKQNVNIVFSFFLSPKEDLKQYELLLEKLTNIMSNQDLLTALRKVKHDENKINLILNKIDALLYEELLDNGEQK